MGGMHRIGIDDSSVEQVLEHGGMRSPSFGIDASFRYGQLRGPKIENCT